MSKENEQDESYKNPAYQAYLYERDILIQGERSQQDSLDKALLSLSSGAFALSLGIVSQSDTIKQSFFLIISWVLLGCAIIAALLSFMFSVKSYERQREINEYLYKNESITPPLKGRKILKNKYLKVVGCLNWVSLCGVLLGIVFLGIFVMSNTRH